MVTSHTLTHRVPRPYNTYDIFLFSFYFLDVLMCEFIPGTNGIEEWLLKEVNSKDEVLHPYSSSQKWTH